MEISLEVKAIYSKVSNQPLDFAEGLFQKGAYSKRELIRKGLIWKGSYSKRGLFVGFLESFLGSSSYSSWNFSTSKLFVRCYTCEQ